MVENIVHKICEKMFLSDFVVSNPKFQKVKVSSIVEHEIADTLVLFKDTLIGFQVKSKDFSNNSKKDALVIINRIKKTITEGVSQLGSIRSAFRSKKVLYVNNRVGIQVELNPNLIKQVIGVVIIDLIHEKHLDNDSKNKISTDFLYNKDIPTHIFSRSDLEFLASELDTVPDFIRYLNTREKIYCNKLLPEGITEKDFLAYYKLNPSGVELAIHNNQPIPSIEGFWNQYLTDYHEKIIERNISNGPSYLIDKIITFIHKSIGADQSIKDLLEDNHHENTKNSYFSAITELASSDRVSRRGYGQVLIEKMKKADSQTNGSYSLSLNKEEKTGLIFLASSRPRKERYHFLQRLATAAYCRFKLEKVIALATEPASADEHYFDIIRYQNNDFENPEKLSDLGKKLFRNIKIQTTFEYRNQIKIKRKFPRNQKCPCGSGSKYKNCCA
jgi:hypothetical protein